MKIRPVVFELLKKNLCTIGAENGLKLAHFKRKKKINCGKKSVSYMKWRSRKYLLKTVSVFFLHSLIGSAVTVEKRIINLGGFVGSITQP